jgi:hypothetical protein
VELVPTCDGCRSSVERLTLEIEDALCDLCLEIERFDRSERVDADLATRLIRAPKSSGRKAR